MSSRNALLLGSIALLSAATIFMILEAPPRAQRGIEELDVKENSKPKHTSNAARSPASPSPKTPTEINGDVQNKPRLKLGLDQKSLNEEVIDSASPPLFESEANTLRNPPSSSAQSLPPVRVEITEDNVPIIGYQFEQKSRGAQQADIRDSFDGISIEDLEGQ
ncbi:hypothetical protein MRY87_03855 [bacterium]|nr:hypothetical protein [bacterium]